MPAGRKRARWSVALATALVAVLAPVATSSAAAYGGPPTPVLQWADCGDGFQCAPATVPLDYDRPHGATIELSLARIPATDQAHRIGSVFVGAPGSSSSVDLLRAIGAGAYDPRIHERFDIVAVDRRGTGGSTPMRCFATGDEANAFYGQYPAYPANRSELAAVDGLNDSYARQCAGRSGALLQHTSSTDVARDLDLLRAAVGDKKLSYIGYSHSAYVGVIYANLFPSRVRSLVLDGPQYAPDLTAGGPNTSPFSRSHSDLAAERSLREFFAQCASAGTRCSFGGGSDARAIAAKYDALSARLARSPIPSPIEFHPGPIGADDLAQLADNGLFSAEGYAFLADELQAIYQAATGQPVTRVAEAPADEPYDNTVDAQAAIFCSELNSPRTVAGYHAEAQRRAAVAPHFGAFYAWYEPKCEDWPGPEADRYTGPWNRSTTPALLIGTQFDPIAYPPGVARLTGLLAGSRMLTVHGWGHLAVTSSTCADGVIGDYVVNGALPRAGTVCEANVAPFS